MNAAKTDNKEKNLLEFLIENNKEVSKWSRAEYILATLDSKYQKNIPVFFNVKKEDYS
ncbi:hypothetical protein JW949_01455 [Candidatus Woesearchaeota archaeon]|nr:hypothetical protein [Candidatus Woesearchaeota archaeon]